LKTEKTKCHRLYWLCSESGRRHPAGVAFFNESKGDYRLKVDALPGDKGFYLKPISMTDGVINFRVEAVVRGSPQTRVEIGVGHASVDTGYPVFMDIGPYCRTLVMEEAV
jgi:hypothetical protein